MRSSFSYFVTHAVFILVKMVPSESEFAAEIAIAIDSHIAKDFDDVLLSLDRGSEIVFNATMLTFSEDLKPRHFHLVDLKKGTGSMEIPEATIYSTGRYAEKPRSFRNIIFSINSNSNNNQLPGPDAVPADNNKDGGDAKDAKDGK